MPSKETRKMDYAIGRTHLEAVRASLENFADYERNDCLLTALMRAALIGQTDAVTVLLDRGLDVNAKDSQGRTALMEATYGGHYDTVKTLLDRGAAPNLADDTGWTALMEAVSKGNYESAVLLVERGSDVNARTRQGWTALKATARGNYAITKLLKEAGAR